MIGAFGRIWADAQKYRIPLRTAAFVVACERVLAARELRGLYP
jgi:glutamate dehydrogenase (NAD(P)+)